MFNPSIYHNLQEALLKNNVLDFLFWVCFLEIGSHYIHLTGLEFVMSTRTTSDAQPSLQGTRIKGEGVPPCLVCMICLFSCMCISTCIWGPEVRQGIGLWGTHTCHVQVRKQLLEICSLLQFRIQKQSSGPSGLCSNHFYPRSHLADMIACFKWLTVSHVIQNSSNQEGV